MSKPPDSGKIPPCGGATDTMNDVLTLSACPVEPILPMGGGEENVASKLIRRGKVTISPLGPGKWRLRWLDPLTGRRGDRRVSGGKKLVSKIADQYNEAIYSKKGYLPTRSVIPSIHDAIAASIRTSKQGKREREQNARYGGLFERWLESSYPAVKDFGTLRPCMVQEYINDLEKSGYSPGSDQEVKRTYSLETLKKRLKPIIAARYYIMGNYPEAGLVPWPKFKFKTRPSLKREQLTSFEIQRLFEVLKSDSPDVYPVMVLTALAGLRPVEVRSLRRQDVDLERGLITVRATDSHDPKTLHSHRTIPVCSEVLKVITETLNQQRVIPATGEIFLRQDGSFWTKDSLCAVYDQTVRARLAEAAGCMRIAEATMYRLRASFRTMASQLGIPEHVTESYFGHAPKDVTDRHYREVPLSQLRRVSNAFEEWRGLPNEDDLGEDLGNSKDGKLRTC